jgi:hypothetical protein
VTSVSLNGVRDEKIQYSMGDRSLDVEIPSSTGEKVIVTFDRIQYPQEVNYISEWAGAYFIANDSGKPQNPGEDPDFSRYSVSGQEARMRQWVEWNELKANYDRNLAANKTAAQAYISKVKDFPADRLPHYFASEEKLKTAGLDYSYIIFFYSENVKTGGFKLGSPPFVQDSLAQVVSEYEANLRRWDAEWKNDAPRPEG